MGEATEGEILMLILGGLHERHAVQRGIWAPTHHLLKGPRKTTDNLDRVGRSQDSIKVFRGFPRSLEQMLS
jgi:hypothetical protein